MSELPVILGGKPSIIENHDKHQKWPLIGKEEKELINNILDDGDISTHPIRHQLEDAYAKRFDRKFTLSHNNGTSALFNAFFSCGLSQGDEVLVTSATWWASVLPMLWLGSIPVFCECEDERFGISIEDMRKKLTKNTKAIVVVHLWGIPSKMKEILKFAKENNLKIIEDASHAHGASEGEVKCGSFGDVSVFSLQGDKLSPAGEGGILLTDNQELFEQSICFGDVTRIFELENEKRRFAATSFGVKTRMAPLSAAIAIPQLSRLDENNQKRNQNIEYISNELEKLGFDTFQSNESYKRVYFEFLIRWTPKVEIPIDALINALKKEGAIVSAPRYPLLHQQPIFTEGHWNKIARIPNGLENYRFEDVDLPKTQEGNNLMIKLPSFPSADKAILDQYIEAFNKVMTHKEQIYNEQ